MDFDLTKEQQQLGDSIQRFVAREYGFEKRKGILRSEGGMSREVWGHLAEMGLLALQIPEEPGGVGWRGGGGGAGGGGGGGAPPPWSGCGRGAGGGGGSSWSRISPARWW